MLVVLRNRDLQELDRRHRRHPAQVDRLSHRGFERENPLPASEPLGVRHLRVPVDRRREVFGGRAEDRAKVELVPRSELGVVLEEEGRLRPADEPRPLPDESPLSGHEFEGREVQDDVPLRAFGLDPERLRRSDRGVVRLFANRLSASITPDLVRLPEGVLPPGDLGHDGVGILRRGRPPPRPDPAEREGGLRLSERPGQDPEILPVQAGALPADRRVKVRLEWQAAVRGVVGEEPFQFRKRLIGPVAPGFRRRETEAVGKKDEVG